MPNPSPDGDFSKHKLNESNATKRLISISAGARLFGYSSTPPIKKLSIAVNCLHIPCPILKEK